MDQTVPIHPTNGLAAAGPFAVWPDVIDSDPLAVLESETGVDLNAAVDSPWVTLVWNDPVNLMSYVSWVFRSYFGFSSAEASRRMLMVHEEGRAVVAVGTREEMERHVEAMHDFGLWATLEKENP